MQLPVLNEAKTADRFLTTLPTIPANPQPAAERLLDRSPKRPCPMTAAEARARGWDEIDIVFVTGDAYIDHPSFAMAILGRVLEAAALGLASSHNRTGIRAPIGNASAGRACASALAPATWTR